ncbi:PAS domain-containing sensor histidine kinase [Alkalilimnicola ehrlichii]|uniref:histidine kinase n=2 Tax=Alkalilimnicola ehrlichii TaxID=351052 RepID=A0A3E0X3Y6_9GAMM|nr:ATP-binding protein [Alkalilimnicola ehrlichii]RFA39424.1 hypothetical protein CAL65_01080 [Alkalilimnicola ehrlichii]
MEEGVLALDEDNRIQLSNRAAARLLGAGVETPGANVSAIAPGLVAALSSWRHHGYSLSEPVLQGEQGEYRVRFQTLDPERRRALAFLQDLGELRVQVQQEKLAGLGRLTASISHEIRNPLSAIVHAGQLLEEAEGLQDGDRRLIEIIRKHSGRLNGIVENVLQLSRRRSAERQSVALQAWLEEFRDSFAAQHHTEHFQLEIYVTPPTLVAPFDREHLHQILDNLCGNALRHGGPVRPRCIAIHARRSNQGQVELEVRDNGQGIAPETANRLFEPFFTTASAGTGLGLYLCRELCEANQAQLHHIPSSSGSCFRIRFGVAHREIA